MTINKDVTVAKSNKVKFNRNKCKVMYLSLKPTQIERDMAYFVYVTKRILQLIASKK